MPLWQQTASAYKAEAILLTLTTTLSMRKLFTLAMAAIAVSAMFVSCTDDKTDPSDPKTDTSPIVEQGTTGDLTWTLSEQGTLRISGTGDMNDYTYEQIVNGVFVTTAPWFPFAETIKNVVIAEGVTSIGNFSFTSCTNLTNVIIPSGVTRIGNGSFAVCENLATVTIPEGVTSIGITAFYLTPINTINIPSSVTNVIFLGHLLGQTKNINFAENSHFKVVDRMVFSKDETQILRCSSDRGGSYSVPEGVIRIDQMSFLGCEKLTGIILPTSLQTIGSHAFNQSGLTSVDIPNAVTSIGDAAFAYCDLHEINVAAGNPNYISVDGVLFDKSQTELGIPQGNKEILM